MFRIINPNPPPPGPNDGVIIAFLETLFLGNQNKRDVSVTEIRELTGRPELTEGEIQQAAINAGYEIILENEPEPLE